MDEQKPRLKLPPEESPEDKEIVRRGQEVMLGMTSAVSQENTGRDGSTGSESPGHRKSRNLTNEGYTHATQARIVFRYARDIA